MSHHEKQGEQEERKSLITPSLHLGFVTEVPVLPFALKLHSQYPQTTELLHVGMGLLIISSLGIGAFCSLFLLWHTHIHLQFHQCTTCLYSLTQTRYTKAGRYRGTPQIEGKAKGETPGCSQHIPELRSERYNTLTTAVQTLT